jgi:hypothetical protein
MLVEEVDGDLVVSVMLPVWTVTPSSAERM